MSVVEFKSEDAILDAIDDGRIRYAFNVASNHSKSRLVRILAPSVIEFLEGKSTPNISEDEDWEQTVGQIFPDRVSTLPAKDIARAWAISSTHVLNLCYEKNLRLARGAQCHTGPNGSPHVEVQSAVEFLHKRRIL